MLGGLAGHPPQHRVDQPAIARRAAVGMHQPHGQIDRRMIRHLEPENLRHPQQQRGLGSRRIGRQAALEEYAEDVPQGPEPPQHGGDQMAHQGAVAVGERPQARIRRYIEQFVERPMAAQHAIENLGREPPRRQSGRLGRYGGLLGILWFLRHRWVVGRFCSWRNQNRCA